VTDPAGTLRTDEADVAGALATTSRIILDVELDLLTFLQRVELAGREGGVVKEDLAAVLGTDKAEPTVSNQANNRTRSHDVSLPAGR
jgi:hypothetical protein